MISFSNGHPFEYMAASGSYGFGKWGLGWLWEKPLIALGIMKPELFTVVLRTLTLKPRLYPESNLSWIRPWTWLPWSPWSCVQFLPNGGAVNKVGLYNHGIDWWMNEVAPTLNFKKVPLVGSIYGTQEELVLMAKMLDQFDFVALEVNVSCPNTGHDNYTDKLIEAELVTNTIIAMKSATRHPLIIKVGVDQAYMVIADGLRGVAEAISLNSVPWHTVFPSPMDQSPVLMVGKPGSGGVSGRLAQKHNWPAVEKLAKQGALPVIAPSVME